MPIDLLHFMCSLLSVLFSLMGVWKQVSLPRFFIWGSRAGFG